MEPGPVSPHEYRNKMTAKMGLTSKQPGLSAPQKQNFRLRGIDPKAGNLPEFLIETQDQAVSPATRHA